MQIFLDMAVLVEAQGDLLNNIESQVRENKEINARERELIVASVITCLIGISDGCYNSSAQCFPPGFECCGSRELWEHCFATSKELTEELAEVDVHCHHHSSNHCRGCGGGCA